VQGAFSEDEEPKAVFSFNQYFGDYLGEHFQFELRNDETELIVRRKEYKKGSTIGEYLMTETTPGDGFTQIAEQPSTI
jgi:hypothetical protein